MKSQREKELEQLIIKLSAENITLREQLTITEKKKDVDFVRFLNEWLEVKKMSLKPSTYYNYKTQLVTHIIPYFEKKQLFLSAITAKDLESFYAYKLEHNCTPNAVLHYHATLRGALSYAYKHDMISDNVAKKAIIPKKTDYKSETYTIAELNSLIFYSRKTQIFIPILIAAELGLRRGEVLGLKWSDIDFANSRVIIHQCAIQYWDGKNTQLVYGTTKSKKSERILTISNHLRLFLMKTIAERKAKETDFVCLLDNGKVISPTYLNHKFKILLQK